MNVIFSVRKKYVDKIILNEKIFEFRNVLPKQFKIGETIYIYETAKNGGKRKIVGELIAEDIINLNPQGKTPMYGCWSFLDYYVETIEKDIESANRFKEMKKYNPENYKFGSLITFALSPYYSEIVKEGKHPNFNPFREEDNKKLKLADKYMYACDDWLRNQGFYDDDDKSYWKYAIKFRVNKIYEIPVELNEFLNQNGEKIVHPPQSWMYTLN